MAVQSTAQAAGLNNRDVQMFPSCWFYDSKTNFSANVSFEIGKWVFEKIKEYHNIERLSGHESNVISIVREAAETGRVFGIGANYTLCDNDAQEVFVCVGKLEWNPILGVELNILHLAKGVWFLLYNRRLGYVLMQGSIKNAQPNNLEKKNNECASILRLASKTSNSFYRSKNKQGPFELFSGFEFYSCYNNHNGALLDHPRVEIISSDPKKGVYSNVKNGLACVPLCPSARAFLHMNDDENESNFPRPFLGSLRGLQRTDEEDSVLTDEAKEVPHVASMYEVYNSGAFSMFATIEDILRACGVEDYSKYLREHSDSVVAQRAQILLGDNSFQIKKPISTQLSQPEATVDIDYFLLHGSMSYRNECADDVQSILNSAYKYYLANISSYDDTILKYSHDKVKAGYHCRGPTFGENGGSRDTSSKWFRILFPIGSGEPIHVFFKLNESTSFQKIIEICDWVARFLLIKTDSVSASYMIKILDEQNHAFTIELPGGNIFTFLVFSLIIKKHPGIEIGLETYNLKARLGATAKVSMERVNGNLQYDIDQAISHLQGLATNSQFNTVLNWMRFPLFDTSNMEVLCGIGLVIKENDKMSNTRWVCCPNSVLESVNDNDPWFIIDKNDGMSLQLNSLRKHNSLEMFPVMGLPMNLTQWTQHYSENGFVVRRQSYYQTFRYMPGDYGVRAGLGLSAMAGSSKRIFIDPVRSKEWFRVDLAREDAQHYQKMVDKALLDICEDGCPVRIETTFRHSLNDVLQQGLPVSAQLEQCMDWAIKNVVSFDNVKLCAYSKLIYEARLRYYYCSLNQLERDSTEEGQISAALAINEFGGFAKCFLSGRNALYEGRNYLAPLAARANRLLFLVRPFNVVQQPFLETVTSGPRILSDFLDSNMTWEFVHQGHGSRADIRTGRIYEDTLTDHRKVKVLEVVMCLCCKIEFGVLKEKANIDALHLHLLANPNHRCPPNPEVVQMLIALKVAERERLLMLSTDAQRYAFNLVMDGYNVYVGGAAGTGKSFVLNLTVQELRSRYLRDEIIVTGTTGVAAENVNGQTLHSWAGIRPNVHYDILLKKIHEDAEASERWRKCKVLFIDEISMLEGSLLKFLNIAGQSIRKNERFFGGIQVVLTGDMLQMPPVQGGSVYAFEESIWGEAIHKVVFLTEILRQKDSDMISLLNRARVNAMTDTDVNEINNNWGNMLRLDSSIARVHIYHTNEDVNRKNVEMLKVHKGLETTYNAIDIFANTNVGTSVSAASAHSILFASSSCSDHRATTFINDSKLCKASSVLCLKIGCPIIVLKNYPDKGVFHGSIGSVISLNTDSIEASFPERANPNRKFTVIFNYVRFEIVINNVVRAIRHTLPVRLAYAMTVHQSTGLTFSALEVHLSSNYSHTNFGAVYVALSRCPNKELILVHDLQKSRCRPEPRALAWELRQKIAQDDEAVLLRRPRVLSISQALVYGKRPIASIL